MWNERRVWNRSALRRRTMRVRSNELPKRLLSERPMSVGHRSRLMRPRRFVVSAVPFSTDLHRPTVQRLHRFVVRFGLLHQRRLPTGKHGAGVWNRRRELHCV